MNNSMSNKAFKQWLSANKQQLAERWSRYIKIRRNEFARFTKTKEQQINYLAVEYLEASFPVEPSAQQIARVEKMLKDNFTISALF